MYDPRMTDRGGSIAVSLGFSLFEFDTRNELRRVAWNRGSITEHEYQLELAVWRWWFVAECLTRPA